MIINTTSTIKQKRKQAHGKCSAKNEKSIPGAIKIDEKEVFDHLDTLVRQSVEETINSLLDAEADAICNANRYQRSPDRLDTRAGSYKRKLLTKAGNQSKRNVRKIPDTTVHTSYVRRFLRLALLAPPIVDAIFAGKAPWTLSLTKLDTTLPYSWKEQMELFGML